MLHPPIPRACRLTAFCILIAGVLLASTLHADAVEYHVSPGGDDANDGSASAPFATIQRALSEPLGPGDVVWLREGVFAPSQHVWIGRSGSASQPLLLAAWPGETAVIDGTNMSDAAVQVQGAHVTLRGLTVRNSPLAGIYVGPGGDNARIEECHVLDSMSNGIFVCGQDWSDTADDVVVQGCHVERACLKNHLGAMESAWPQAVSAHFARRTVFRGNLVERSWGEGIDAVIADSVLIEDNTVRDVYANGIYLDNAKNCTVQRNLVISSGDPDFHYLGGPMRGIVIANENSWFAPEHAYPCSDNDLVCNVVLFCRLGVYYGNYEGGGGLRNTRIAWNTIHGSTQAAVQIDEDTHHNSLLTGNIFSIAENAAMFGWTDPGSFAGLTFATNCWRGGSAQSAAHAGDVNVDFSEALFRSPGGVSMKDYIPAADSPVLNAADPAALFQAASHDALGRWRGARPDMGALEFIPLPPGVLQLLR